MATINMADKLAARLAKMVKSADGQPRVSVGFLAGVTNSKNEPIPPIAAANEFGVPSRNQPPRPFFRRMIAEKSPRWGDAVAANMKATDYDVAKTLDRMGQAVAAQLKQSIRDLVDPPLSPKTIARKKFDKPLIDTGDMLNAVDYRVDLE